MSGIVSQLARFSPWAVFCPTLMKKVTRKEAVWKLWICYNAYRTHVSPIGRCNKYLHKEDAIQYYDSTQNIITAHNQFSIEIRRGKTQCDDVQPDETKPQKNTHLFVCQILLIKINTSITEIWTKPLKIYSVKNDLTANNQQCVSTI